MAALHRILHVLILFSLYSVSTCFVCSEGVSTPGYTYPSGDITLEYGQNLDILCILHEGAVEKHGPNPSKYMRFYLKNEIYPSEIVNSTAIRLHIEKHPKTKNADYYCMLNDTFTCHNIVTVGTQPKPVKDFDCIGLNYENFTCTWTAPENYVATTYELAYKPAGRPSSEDFRCPMIDYKSFPIVSCTWALSTKPQYRHSHERFVLQLNATNIFRREPIPETYTINHYAKIRPNPPENLHAIEKSPHSLKLNWSVPLYIRPYGPGLEYRVSWWIEQNKKWITEYVKSNKTNVVYELENLPYAHCLYDIRVAIKCRPAVEERMWSLNSSVTVWTMSKLPDCPPNITQGSFEYIEGTGSGLIYWQHIHSYQENGENFSYYVQVEEDPSIRPIKLQSNYAKFDKLSNRNFTFRIWSQNSEGKSENHSVIFVPARKYAMKQLSKLVKFDKGSGEYDLEWTTEPSDPRITNYTLFWCSAQKERPNPCDGTLHWEIIPLGVKNKTLKLPTHDQKTNQPINIYQFAISVNGHGTSSGMLWADCTVIPGFGVKLTQTYVKTTGSRYIVLQWKLQCIKLGAIKSFNVSYCNTVNPQTEICEPSAIKYRLFERTSFRTGEGELNITDLKPNTLYIIRVKPIVVDSEENQFSDPIYNITLADVPTEPRNLRVLKITDRTIVINWQKPLEENGVLTKYKIKVNGEQLNETVAHDKAESYYSKTIIGLRPRTKYTLQVLACHSVCSNGAEQTITTDYGHPSNITEPLGKWQDNNTLFLKWGNVEAGVKVDFYEVEVSATKGREDYHIFNTTDSQLKLYLCQNDKLQTNKIRVRAVNIKDGRFLAGNWSAEGMFPCGAQSTLSTWVIPLSIFFGIIFLILMFYLVKKAWRKVLGMRNCPVKLPPGLDAVVNNFETKEKHTDETLPGEPLLPEKFSSQPRNPSGETSGCCSGTESVSSSVESAGHLSLSDSGTEQPRSPSLGDVEQKDVSLRQRPNVKKTDYLTMTEIPQAPWMTKPAQSGYSVIGVNTPPKRPDDESEFMPLADINDKKSYVPFSLGETQEPIKQPLKGVVSSGYVPYLTQEPASKNTAYVLAGAPTPSESLGKLAAKLPVFPQKGETMPEIVSSPPLETPKLFPWQQGALAPPSTGYVVVGDTKPQKTDSGLQKSSNKGYVPHNIKFDSSKSLKED